MLGNVIYLHGFCSCFKKSAFYPIQNDNITRFALFFRRFIG